MNVAPVAGAKEAEKRQSGVNQARATGEVLAGGYVALQRRETRLRDDMENGAQHQGIPMEYTLTSAAKAVGVHKASIHRAVKSGKLSARRLEDGTYRIDASELARVYEVKPPATERATVQRDDPHPPAEPPATARDKESAMVIALLREQLERERETVADLRTTVSRLLLALPAPQKPQDGPSRLSEGPEPSRSQRGFLSRFWGR